jgi:lysine-specific demethylase 3
MSRFCKIELTKAISDMEALLCEPDVDAIPVHDDILDSSLNGHIHTSFAGPSSSLSPTNPPDMSLSNTNTDSSGVSTPPELALAIPMNFKSFSGIDAQTDPHLGAMISESGAGGALSELPSHVTQRFTDAELTDDVFRPIWAMGRPLVVTGLLSKFKIHWTPEYFMEKYKSQPCLIIECQTDTNKRVTVGDFFALFGKYEGRTDCWKLKVCWQTFCDVLL